MAYYHTGKLTEIKSPKQQYDGPHFLIIIFSSTSVYHEADERSKQCPGHGYPAYTETIESNKIFGTTVREDWVNALKGLYKEDQNRKDIVAYEVKGAPKIQIAVEIN